MNAAEMLKGLQEQGLTEMRIAAELGICQSSINKIKKGVIKNPSPGIVRGIELLYHIILAQKSKSGAKA